MSRVEPAAALKLGFSQVLSRWPMTLLAVLLGLLEPLGASVMTISMLMWLGGAKAGAIGCALSAVAFFFARVLQLLVLGGAIRQSAHWLDGRPVGFAFEEVWAAAPRVLSFVVWALPLDLIFTAWRWVGVVATSVAFARALGAMHAGAWAAASLAWFVTLALVLTLGWAFIRRVALVATVRNDVPSTVGLALGCAQLAQTPWSYVAVLLVGVLLGALSEGALSISGSVLAPRGAAGFMLEPQLVGQLCIGVLGATVASLCELVTIYGFTALMPQRAPAAAVASEVPAIS